MQPYRIGGSQIALPCSALKCHRLEWLLVVAPLIVKAAERELLLLQRLRQPYRDQPVAMRIRQWPKENAIHHTEYRGRRPDAQPQRRQRGDREYRFAAKSAQRITHILPQRIEEPSG